MNKGGAVLWAAIITTAAAACSTTVSTSAATPTTTDAVRWARDHVPEQWQHLSDAEFAERAEALCGSFENRRTVYDHTTMVELGRYVLDDVDPDIHEADQMTSAIYIRALTGAYCPETNYRLLGER